MKTEIDIVKVVLITFLVIILGVFLWGCNKDLENAKTACEYNASLFDTDWYVRGTRCYLQKDGVFLDDYTFLLLTSTECLDTK